MNTTTPDGVTIAMLAEALGTPEDRLLDAANRCGLLGRRTDLPLTVAAVAAIQRELHHTDRTQDGPAGRP